MKKFLTIALLFPLILVGRTAYAQDVNYTAGIFIINEGWFGHENGSLNFINKNGEIAYRVYTKENPKESFGATTQYGCIYGDNFYFVSKQEKDYGDMETISGGRLVVADAITLKKKASFDNIGGGDGRSFLGVNDTVGYVGTSNGIVMFDIKNLTIGNIIDSTGSAQGSLYANQIGNMVRIGDRVFAAKQGKGVLVIDANTNKYITLIPIENVGTLVQSFDGNLWVSAHKDGLLQIDPYTFDADTIKLPQNSTISNTWGAWNAGPLSAATKENVLYWTRNEENVSGLNYFGKRVCKYDIDKKELDTSFYILTRTSGDNNQYHEAFYGAGLRVDPLTDNLVITTTETGFLTHYLNNWIHIVDSKSGELIQLLEQEKHYWFPAMSVFPDNYPPQISISDTLYLEEPLDIDLRQYVTDKDNSDAAIIIGPLQIIDIDGDIDINITRGRLIIEPNCMQGSATVKLSCNSNGKSAEKLVKIRVGHVGYEHNAETRVNVYPNPVTNKIYITSIQNVPILLLDMKGKVIVNQVTTDSNIELTVTDLPQGIYILRVGSHVEKIIKH